jgi:hypothetical protein
MTRFSHPLGLLLAAAVSAGSWFAWMAGDTSYQIDPVTGDFSGPYEKWQVAGCGVCLVLVALLTGLALPDAWASALVITVAFTAAWSVTAAAGDRTGLWLVGAVVVFLGVGLASTVVCYAGALARRIMWGRRPVAFAPTVA